MIRSRRRAHACIALLLPLALALLVLAAVRGRRATVYPERLPAALLEELR